MVKSKYLKPLLAGSLVVMALYVWLRPGAAPVAQTPAAPAAAVRLNPAARAEALPAIGLDRVSGPREPTEAGRRNVFEFYQPPPPPPPRVIANPQAMLPAVPTPTPVPPLNIKYVGTAERSGARKAIFLTDHNEVLTGGEGETVANRVKVVRINLESIDVQDLWSGQPRRLPLKGN